MSEKKQLLIEAKKKAKELYTPEQLDEALKHIQTLALVGIRVSTYSFCEVQEVMKKRNLAGVPFLDTKTFNGWRAVGRRVKRGEKAIYQSVSWNKIENIKEHADGTIEVKDEFSGGKVYSIFHISQTEEIKSREDKQ